LTPDLAQIALSFGADDLDGTIIEERIIHGAGTPTSTGMTKTKIEKCRELACSSRSRNSAHRSRSIPVY
jgi:aminodeoxyfutalosine synthase